MTDPHGTPPDSSAATQLRAALLDHSETVMSLTDTERELTRFQDVVRRHDSRRRVLAAAASVAVLAAAGGGYLALRDAGGPTPLAASGGDVSGSLVVDLQTYSDTGESPDTHQSEARDALWTGTLSITTPDGTRSGDVEVRGSAGLVETSDGPKVFHGWGTVTATLDDAECVGSYGTSFYRSPALSGGALQLSCDDGTVLGATVLSDDLAVDVDDDVFRHTMRLVDASYVAP